MQAVLFYFLLHISISMSFLWTLKPQRSCGFSLIIISPYSVAFGVILSLLFVCFFLFKYGWGYLNAGWCDRREILAQGRANTRDENEIVRGWSAHGGPWAGDWIFTLRSMGKYCVIHISETRGAIDTKFAGYIHPVLLCSQKYSLLGSLGRGGFQRRGVEHFLGWGYSFSWIGQLPFVFAWASSNVVQ